MRLPADATLIVIGADEPAGHSGEIRPADANIAALITAWQREGLPLVHLRSDALAPSAPPPRFVARATPVEDEPIVAEAEALENLLDGAGATTLVMCGALSPLEATALCAGDQGYRIFVVSDACWSDGDAPSPTLALLGGGTATLVEAAATLSAAATAKARERLQSERRRAWLFLNVFAMFRERAHLRKLKAGCLLSPDLLCDRHSASSLDTLSLFTRVLCLK